MPQGSVIFRNDWGEDISFVTIRHRRSNNPYLQEEKTIYDVDVGQSLNNVLEFTYEIGTFSFDYWWIKFITRYSQRIYTIKDNFYCNVTGDDDGYVRLRVDASSTNMYIDFSSSSGCGVSIYEVGQIGVASLERVINADYSNEKSRRDVQSSTSMISDFVGKNNRSTFQLGRYEPGFWDNDGYNNWRQVNNCYAFACNIRVDDKKLPPFCYPHPGFRKLGRAPRDRNELLEGLRLDGLVKIKEPEWEPETAENGSHEQPVWLIAVGDGYTTEGNNYWYHCYRKVWSGNRTSSGANFEECFFAHKNGDDPVTNKIKGSSLRIIDPMEDMKERNLTYIGYYLVPRKLSISTPSS